MPARYFASDNSSTVHPSVFAAMSAANRDHFLSYGSDPYTQRAVADLRELFDSDVSVYFVYNGTGANVLGLSMATKPYEAVICTEMAHIQTDECGAPEHFTGGKLLPVHAEDGKLSPGDIARFDEFTGVEHHVQPHVVSLTQATEVGTVYTAQEITAICAAAHERGYLVHVDGARIANAAASLASQSGPSGEAGGADSALRARKVLRAITGEAGVDILSFGGTKNGLMFGEAVVFFPGTQRELPDPTRFRFVRKQGMQLASKMRYISAQFSAYVGDDLWFLNAAHANRMAVRLADGLSRIEGVEPVYRVQANGVFVKLPRDAVRPLSESFPFYVWDEAQSVARLMCSFDTQEEDVDAFVAAAAAAVHH